MDQGLRVAVVVELDNNVAGIDGCRGLRQWSSPFLYTSVEGPHRPSSGASPGAHMGARHRSPLGSYQSPFAFALRVPNLLLHLVNQPHQGIERAHVDMTLAM